MYTDYKDCIEKVMVSEEEIDKAVTRIAYEIEEDFKNSDKKLLLLGVLKGSVIFMADIMKKLNIPLETDFIKVSSYGSGTTSGKLCLKAEPDRTDLSDYNVVVIEDILDTGNTPFLDAGASRKRSRCRAGQAVRALQQTRQTQKGNSHPL